MGFMGGIFRALGFEGEKKPKAEKQKKGKAAYNLNKTETRVEQIDGVPVYYPENYEQVGDFLSFVMEGKAIIISIQSCGKEDASRILDFVDGFIFASSARLICIDEKKLYLILPEGMEVEG